SAGGELRPVPRAQSPRETAPEPAPRVAGRVQAGGGSGAGPHSGLTDIGRPQHRGHPPRANPSTSSAEHARVAPHPSHTSTYGPPRGSPAGGGGGAGSAGIGLSPGRGAGLRGTRCEARAGRAAGFATPLRSGDGV